MAMAGLYRRVLPSPPAIDFASNEGKQLFLEAIQNGTMEGFFKLISYFQTQSEPAYCGLASLSMVLNALSIDPGRKWKGPWRWFDESMLDCCEPLEKVKAKGISFGKVVCLAHCAGAKVEAFRSNLSTIDDFRKHVMACTASDDCHLISSYHRGLFKQTGSGHFSPIGGYHVEKDMALILDVARFKYPPHWVPLPLLWEAMNTIDEATGLHRGFMLVSKLHRAPALLYTLEEVLKQVHDTPLYKHVTSLLFSEDSVCQLKAAMDSSLTNVAASICCQGAGLFAGRSGSLDRFCCRQTCVRCYRATGDNPATVVSGTVVNGNGEQGVDVLVPTSQAKTSCCPSGQDGCSPMHPGSNDVLTALLLALPPQTWSSIKDMKVLQEIENLVSPENLPPLLQEEILHLRGQFLLLKRCKDNKRQNADVLLPFIFIGLVKSRTTRRLPWISKSLWRFIWFSEIKRLFSIECMP